MERTIHKFIPFIRFYHMTSEDFLSKVYPFKVLIPKDMIDNLLAFHMKSDEKLNTNIIPPRSPEYDSILVNNKHYFALFSSWIEKKNDYSRV
ncbi:BTB/POZ domain-containing protein [Rhizophagus clarus]|uniref:BTB/POZ domain-containing protein n=1 Tax=Rhizophagus clarus TaxID=94130 RepID=A0A8H3L386_9GLOM|nr:BTB/POZ domain-containing protein [Rhizophagus clarus]